MKKRVVMFRDRRLVHQKGRRFLPDDFPADTENRPLTSEERLIRAIFGVTSKKVRRR